MLRNVFSQDPARHAAAILWWSLGLVGMRA